VVSSGGDRNLSFFLGNGDGTFQQRINYEIGEGPSSIAVADFNRDGLDDIAVTNSGIVSVLLNTTPVVSYKAFVQEPIEADGSSVFSARRGVIPVKFTLTQAEVATCALPAAIVSITRTAGATLGSVDESIYLTPADIGSNFRIDPSRCQYIYNLAASSVGVGTYRVDISINGNVVGNAVFALK
jgi:hypothetical protein